MDIINAIAKARFASTGPQRVALHKSGACRIELLCMEPSQKHCASAGRWAYYVITGSAAVAAGGKDQPLAAGQLALPDRDEAHTVLNSGEGRLVCLVVAQTS